MSSRHILWLPTLMLGFVSWAAPVAASVTLQNDSWSGGPPGAYVGTLSTSESFAVRFDAGDGEDHVLEKVRFLLGGSTDTVDLQLAVYQDLGGAVPTSLLYQGIYSVTGADDVMHEIDLDYPVVVNGPFRVSLKFINHFGYPGPAHDDDYISGLTSFFFSSSLGWQDAIEAQLQGDWVLRAVISPPLRQLGGTVTGSTGPVELASYPDDTLLLNADGPYSFPTAVADSSLYLVTVLSEPPGQDCLLENAVGAVLGADVENIHVTCIDDSLVTRNDGWEPGLGPVNESGIGWGAVVAARLSPVGPGLRRITAVHFFYQGSGLGDMVLRIWADGGGATPGVELFSMTVGIPGQPALQQIDLTPYDIQVIGNYRVGFEFLPGTLSSFVRDDLVPFQSNDNFIRSDVGVWEYSYYQGVSGNWIIRAVDEAVAGYVPPLTITAIDDLPNDQGRQVRIRWKAAEDDAPGGLPPVTGYAIFRRIEPGYKSAADHTATGKAYPPGDWEYLLTVPAFQELDYATIVPTVADSTVADGMHWSTFFVRATTADPGIFSDSPPDSGWSVDNLAPGVPQGLQVAFTPGQGNDLAWYDAPEGDFRYFKVYRGLTPDFPVDPQAPAHTTTTPAWLDATGDPADFYRISAVDFAGNEGPPSDGLAVSAAPEVPGLRDAMAGNHPNPFNPRTTIAYSLARAADVRLAVYDSRGALVRTLVDGVVESGEHRTVWDGTDRFGAAVGSGTYFSRLEIDGGRTLTRAMTLIK